MKFDSAGTTGTFLKKWGTRGTGYDQFEGAAKLAVNAAGNVFVADPFNYRVQKFFCP